MDEQQGNLAFEVFRNGQRVCIAGLDGEAGVISISIDQVRQTEEQELYLRVAGLKSSNRHDHILWSLQQLQVGDEVAVHLSPDSRPSQPGEFYQLSDRSGDERELDWLKKTAKRRGFRLVRTASDDRRRNRR